MHRSRSVHGEGRSRGWSIWGIPSCEEHRGLWLLQLERDPWRCQCALDSAALPVEKSQEPLLLKSSPSLHVPSALHRGLSPSLLKELSKNVLNRRHRRNEDAGQSRNGDGFGERRFVMFAQHLDVKVAARRLGVAEFHPPHCDWPLCILGVEEPDASGGDPVEFEEPFLALLWLLRIRADWSHIPRSRDTGDQLPRSSTRG